MNIDGIVFLLQLMLLNDVIYSRLFEFVKKNDLSKSKIMT